MWVFLRGINALLVVSPEATSQKSDGLSIAVAVSVVGFLVQELFETNFSMGLATLLWVFLAIGLFKKNRGGVESEL